jgi:hypothetical protein
MLRPMIISAVLLTIAIVGLHTISDAIAAARDTRPATFSERFEPVFFKPAT